MVSFCVDFREDVFIRPARVAALAVVVGCVVVIMKCGENVLLAQVRCSGFKFANETSVLRCAGFAQNCGLRSRDDI